MPFITNTKNDEFGHAQTQRDIEYLYMLLGSGETQINDSGMSQEIGDDTVDGSTLAGRGGVIINNITTGPTVYYLECLDGNLLFTASAVNYYGLKRPSAVVTEVPSLTPPAAAGGCPDGLSRAQLISNTGATSVVWVGNRLKPGIWSGGSIISGPSTYDDFPGAIPSNNTFISKRQVSVPVTGSANSYAIVYNPWRV